MDAWVNKTSAFDMEDCCLLPISKSRCWFLLIMNTTVSLPWKALTNEAVLPIEASDQNSFICVILKGDYDVFCNL